ncbi:Isochorismatase-like protein [Sordaria brevicollis]|uniref:Isochorismatase-like protein n=1 Tax=Sordaria brevicollis TaxID=83679 RepID=A0AAE0P1R1_SORBR|nr:Isochorismatase-like protein [Sordaria brevicollis]
MSVSFTARALYKSTTLKPILRPSTFAFSTSVPSHSYSSSQKRLSSNMAAPAPQRGFEKFRNAIYEFDKVVSTTSKLLSFAHTLSIPIYITTQTRSKLGPTVSELQPLLLSPDGVSPHPLVKADLDKTLFGMYTPALAALFAQNPEQVPSHIALVGIESHICVTQTCLALRKRHPGMKIYVIADGVSSCNKEEIPIALARLRQEGVTVTSSEGWMYECMGDAGIKEFREVVKIVKETGEGTKAALRALAKI